jgi:hypothetical protein
VPRCKRSAIVSASIARACHRTAAAQGKVSATRVGLTDRFAKRDGPMVRPIQGDESLA